MRSDERLSLASEISRKYFPFGKPCRIDPIHEGLGVIAEINPFDLTIPSVGRIGLSIEEISNTPFSSVFPVAELR